MQTYKEVYLQHIDIGSESFPVGAEINWPEFLNKASYTQGDMIRAYNAANSWVTCACGNQCAAIPRDSDGEPKDDQLRLLGGYFIYMIKKLQSAVVALIYDKEQAAYRQVELNKARQNAIDCLQEIEARSAFLLQGMGAV